ncbi:hypothetical protein [Yinghuangia aomiensis]|uniref:hypothetical protein n=1 Tax=Yinghuangia aomiensis TaxID=676205 RepID=UPI0031EE0DF2
MDAILARRSSTTCGSGPVVVPVDRMSLPEPVRVARAAKAARAIRPGFEGFAIIVRDQLRPAVLSMSWCS